MTDASTDVRYAVKVHGRWMADMLGLKDTAGSSEDYAGIMNYPIDDITIEGLTYELKNKKQWNIFTGYDKDKRFNGPIFGLKIYGDVVYSVHIKGGDWTPGVSHGVVAGNELPIDGLRITRV